MKRRVFFGLFLSLSLGLFAQTAEKTVDRAFEQKVSHLISDFSAEALSVQQLKARQAAGEDLVLFDARSADEYAVSHLAGAIHVGFENFEPEEAAKRVGPDQTVVVYCSVGYRSGEVAEKLQERGVKAYNLFGGIFEWVNQQNPIVDEEEDPTVKVHAYSPRWGKWLQKGKKVYKK